MHLNYALNQREYSWENALLWGNCKRHFEKANEQRSSACSRFIHGLIFLVELLPVVGQIASIAEKLIVECYSRPSGHSVDWSEREISVGNNPYGDVQDVGNAHLAPAPRIAHQLEYFRTIPGCQLYGEAEEQVEIALDGERIGPHDVFSPWKLHISATPQNAGRVLEAVRGELIRNQVHFKFIKNEALLAEYNRFVDPLFPERGRFKEGKFITIYAANDEHALILASQLNEALELAIEEGVIPPNTARAVVNRTDRPIGNTGFLWARHDMAGSPITDADFNEGSHAAASEGNYRITTHFPADWAFRLDPKQVEARIQTRAPKVVTVLQPDLFERDWGQVQWNAATRCFERVL